MAAEAMPLPFFIPFLIVFALFGLFVSLLLAEIFGTQPWFGLIVFGAFIVLFCYAQFG